MGVRIQLEIFDGFGLPNSVTIRHYIGPLGPSDFNISNITRRSDHEPADSPIG